MLKVLSVPALGWGDQWELLRAPQCPAHIYIYIYNTYIYKYSTVKGREVLTEP